MLLLGGDALTSGENARCGFRLLIRPIRVTHGMSFLPDGMASTRYSIGFPTAQSMFMCYRRGSYPGIEFRCVGRRVCRGAAAIYVEALDR